MPAYLVGGRAVASFAGFKNHYALYFVSPTLFDAIARDLPNREASKGIIRFDLDEPVPEAVVQRLASWSQTEGAAPVAVKGLEAGEEARLAQTEATKAGVQEDETGLMTRVPGRLNTTVSPARTVSGGEMGGFAPTAHRPRSCLAGQ